MKCWSVVVMTPLCASVLLLFPTRCPRGLILLVLLMQSGRLLAVPRLSMWTFVVPSRVASCLESDMVFLTWLVTCLRLVTKRVMADLALILMTEFLLMKCSVCLVVVPPLVLVPTCFLA